MNKPPRAPGKPAQASKTAPKGARKPSPPNPAGPGKTRPKTHVATEASRRRQHNAHAASEAMDEGEERVRQMAALAAAVASSAVDAAGHRVGQDELERMIRRALRQRDDETLYEALEQLRFEDRRAYALLRQATEDAADMVVLRHGEREWEINAFLIPLLVRTQGGLDAARVFADGDAFDTLRASVQQAGLESAKARVVLVHHLYHPDEIDALTYSEVEAMNRDAFASLTDKKVMAVPAIERSMRGWPQASFGAQDEALELRYLLGFALKQLDDPFYAIPQDEAAADAYFEQRATRFQQWTERYTPLMRQCLTGDTSGQTRCELHFLYQDLFHGARAAGNAEYHTLAMMAALEQGLAEAGVGAAQAVAVLAAVEEAGDMVLEVRLRGAGRTVAQSAHVLDGDVAEQLADAADAVASLGVAQLKLADGFAADGAPLRERDFPA